VSLRRRQHRWSLPGRPQLLVDSQLSAQEVDPVDRQAEQLALPQPGAGGHDHGRPDVLGSTGREGAHLVAGQRHQRRPVDLGQPGTRNRVRRQPAILDRRREQRAQRLRHGRDRGRLQPQLARPALDVLAPQSRQRPVAQLGQDVQP
jgi:hypothetical protein